MRITIQETDVVAKSIENRSNNAATDVVISIARAALKATATAVEKAEVTAREEAIQAVLQAEKMIEMAEEVLNRWSDLTLKLDVQVFKTEPNNSKKTSTIINIKILRSKQNVDERTSTIHKKLCN